MGFLDNIGKAISDVGQKGKDIASIAKFNRLIADEERDITKIFEQIGKKYFEEHGEDFEESFGEMFTGINEAKERIKGYKDTLDNLQGIVRCPNCGTDLPGDAQFCPECGQKVEIEKADEKAADPNKYYCTECGEEVKPGMKFCIHCGTEVHIPEPVEPEEAADEIKEAADDLQDAADEKAE